MLEDSNFLTLKMKEQSTVYVTAGLDGGKKKKKRNHTLALRKINININL